MLLWLDASNAGSVTLSYNSVTTTSTSSSSNVITVSSAANLVVGERVQIGGSSDTQLASVNDTSNIYTITNISGTSVTLDASPGSVGSGTTIYGGYVKQMADLSGNNNTASQSTPSAMPLWISNGQNGLGILQFNGSSDYLTFSTLSFPSATYDFAYQITRSVSNATGPIGYGLGAAYGLNNYLGGFYWFNNNGDIFRAPSMPANQSPTIINIGQSGSAWSSSENGVSYAPSLQTGTAPTVNEIGHTAAGYSAMNYYEVAIYNTALSTNATALLNQYESAKWGVALTGPGVIGSEAGLTGAEAQAAMASVQAGATTDGYSVFSSSYLNRLSQSSNIILQASNNINLDLQGTTLSLAAGKNITLTAANQIINQSVGTITTSQSAGSGGNITINATNGILVNYGLTLNSSGGNISFNNATTLNAAVNANAGNGTLTFASTVNGANNLTATGGTVNFNAAVGGITPLNNLAVNTDALTLASTAAASNTLTIAPYTHGNSVGIGPTSGSNDNFSDALIADTTAASYVFGATTAGDGSATTGNMTVNTATNFGNANVSFISGGNITLASSLTTTGGSITFNAPLTISNASTINSGSGSINFNGAITDTGGLTINSTTTNTISQSISGAGGLTDAGAGTLILTGANTYGGTTTISAGTLQVGAGATSGTLGSGAVTDNATLAYNRSDYVGVTNAISGAGSFSYLGTGDLALSASNSYSGGTTVSNGGYLIACDASALGTGTVTVNANSALGLWWNTGSSTLSNAIVLNSAGVSGNTNGQNGKSAIYADGSGAGYGTYTLSGTITLNNAASSLAGFQRHQ